MTTKVARRLAYLAGRAAHYRCRGDDGRAVGYDQAAEELRAELRHQKRCLCCGKALDDPESVSRGYGPDCWAKMRRAS